jgi:hypothetical protein
MHSEQDGGHGAKSAFALLRHIPAATIETIELLK